MGIEKYDEWQNGQEKPLRCMKNDESEQADSPNDKWGFIEKANPVDSLHKRLEVGIFIVCAVGRLNNFRICIWFFF